ncbi:MAG: hypothetical protein CFH01_01560 [Alphaproteobacteria bacterium MarineAlpha2_Bin1]|nr:MAG: hypothetical protein CFH01_01560 [Alphaproteobacteria bacterium MarineAlpha2_Bin1]
MTEINFYNITRSSVEKLLPRLLEKILQEGSTVDFLFKSLQKLEYIDDFLWTYTADSFIPHSTNDLNSSNLNLILLSLKEKDNNNADVFVTIEGFLPENIEKYKKVIDIFNGKDTEIFKDALDRVEKIRNKGYKVHCWRQENSGWEKAEQY